MATPIKNAAEIEKMRVSGKILAQTLKLICEAAKPGVSTKELDLMAEEFIISQKGKPAFKGFHGYPATICTGLNEVIVHGIPKESEILKDGDLLTLDCGVSFNGYCTDSARTISIGEPNKKHERMIKTGERALEAATDIIKPGTPVGEIGKIIEQIVEKEGYKIIHDLTGHGIGKELHESPTILNYWEGKNGPRLESGMTIAVEPIFSESTHDLKTLQDGWSIVTADGSLSVQIENTILVTENGAEVLTKWQ